LNDFRLTRINKCKDMKKKQIIRHNFLLNFSIFSQKNGIFCLSNSKTAYFFDLKIKTSDFV